MDSSLQHHRSDHFEVREVHLDDGSPSILTAAESGLYCALAPQPAIAD